MGRYDSNNLINIIIGISAVLLSLAFLFLYRTDFTIVAVSIFFVLICTTDSYCGKVPNLLNAALVITGFGMNIYDKGLSGFVFSLSGLALGIVLLLLPYMMGGFGAGDVKALGALGALIGPYNLLHVFVYMAFWGGGFALIYNLFSKDLGKSLQSVWHSVKASALTRDFSCMASGSSSPKRRFVRFPYATAIAFGYYTFLIYGRVL